MTKKRERHAGALYHIYSRGNNKGTIFNNEDDILKHQWIIKDTNEKEFFFMHSYTNMTNHYHMIIETPENNISKIMQLINQRYAQYYNSKYSRTGKFFEREFQSKIVNSDEYFLNLVKYIHNNWVEAGDPIKKYDTLYCSYGSYIHGKKIYEFLETEKTKSYFTKNGEYDVEIFKNFHKQNPKDIIWKPLRKNNTINIQLLKKLNQSNLSMTEKKQIICFELNKQGIENKEIASILNIKRNSVKQAIRRIKKNPAKTEQVIANIDKINL